MTYEIQAVVEGYISQEDVVYSDPREFPTLESGAIYKAMAEGIDWYRDMDYTERMYCDETNADKSYRYTYHPKILKKGGKIVGCSVVMSDIGK